jgi:nucleotide-binding universal stress UspA family protein
MRPIQTILLAVDFSDHSIAATDTATEFAKKFGAEIQVVHAFELHIPFVSSLEIAVPDPYIEESREIASNKLAEVEEKIRKAGVRVETHLEDPPAAVAITRVAEQIDADLIVMGTRGNTGIKHFFLGSVAERTQRLAPCSVLTVKLPE